MKITLVTISFNQANFIRETIESVLNQAYKNYEYIIVDGGSNDGSRDIISSYKKKISQIIFEKDFGPADALNKGFKIATGEIYGFLNSDDLLLPSALTEVNNFFCENPNIDVVSGNAFIINEHGKYKRKFFSDKYNLNFAVHGACTLVQQSTFFRSRMFLKTKGFNLNNNFSWDSELFLDMAKSGAAFANVSSFWSKFRMHPDSITVSKRYNFSEDYFAGLHKKIYGAEPGYFFILKIYIFRYLRKLFNYNNTIQRILYGPIA